MINILLFILITIISLIVILGFVSFIIIIKGFMEDEKY